MNNQSLIRLMVVVCLIGFICLSTYVFYACWHGKTIVDKPIFYLFNTLSGLVGGIFALAFGLPSPSSSEGLDRTAKKIHSLSNMMTSDEKSEKLGYFYALSYIIIGIAAIVIWIVKSDEAVCNHIVTISQVFLGMMVAIVTGYFKN